MNCAEPLLLPGNRRPVTAAQQAPPRRCSTRRGSVWPQACGEGVEGGSWHRHPSPCALGQHCHLETRGSHARRVGRGHYLPLGEEGPPNFANQNLPGRQNATGPVRMAREQLLTCMLVVGGEKAKAGPSRQAGHAETQALRPGHSWTWADKATETAPPPGVHTGGDRGRD